MGFLTGKPGESSSSSTNVNRDLINKTFSGAAGSTGRATGMLEGLLGIGGDPAAAGAAFDQFKDSTGFSHLMKAGQQAITSNQAAKGLFASGATGKALTKFGTGLGDTYLKDYMSQLQGVGQLGLGAGGLITSAGQTSQSKQKEGKKGLLGSVVGGIL